MRWKFVLLILIITVIQFSLLKVVLQYGFTIEDPGVLFEYKIIGPDLTFLDKYLLTLRVAGLYNSYKIMYLGFLESLFKGNYQAYWLTGIFLKILATISLYPLISAIFKRKSLAFLTTLLYGISYSASGALYYIVLGSDYVAIFFMNVFLLSYYYYFATRKKLFLYTATILLFLSFMLSPPRMYPLFAFIFLIEVFVWIRSGKLLGFLTLLSRLILLLFPYLIVLHFFPGATNDQLKGPLTVFNFLSYGNYHLLLTPFAGLGYTFLTNDYWPLVFGPVTFDSFKSYLLFLLHGPVIIYSFLAILLGFLITKTPLFFILGIILVNLCFEMVSYFLITNTYGMVGPNFKSFLPVSIYAIFFGFFCLSVAFAGLIIWLKGHRLNILLPSLFIGPIFSSVFLWGLWFIKGEVLNFTEGIHWYLVIAPIGTSLFLASLMVLIFDRIRLTVNPYLKYVLIGFLFITILPLYLISAKEINTTFTYLLQTGYKASDQVQMKAKLLSYIKEPLDKNPALFYFETQEEPIFYPISLIVGFEAEMHYRNWELVNGCVGLIYDRDKLEKSVAVKDGVKGFNAASLCVDPSGTTRPEMFYTPDNFYAFKLKDKDAIDITKNVLYELGFK